MTQNAKAMLQPKHLFSRTSSARGQDEMHVLRRSLQPNVSSGSFCSFSRVLDYFGWGLPSGKHTKNYGKSQFLMGKSTITGHFQ